MNAGTEAGDSSIHYYDGDYPSPVNNPYPENFDETTRYQGLAEDIRRYTEIAAETGGPILEACCGTGRVAIPLMREGHEVVGVDVASGMLRQFEANLEREEEAVRARVTLFEADVCRLALAGREFPLIVVAFNSLLCIDRFEGQRAALRALADHLAPGGRLVLDIVNPLMLDVRGEPSPQHFFTRRNPRTGNLYSRIAMKGPFDAEQRQRLYGWYDEVDEESAEMRRRFYSLYWRPIFRYEIELMLGEVGLEIAKIEGGHLREPFLPESPRMFIQARRRTA